MKANRKHKDSLFSSLFSNPDVLRELYSAIEGVPVPKDTPIEINTLSGVLYKDKINDLSFIIDNRLVVLIEHQSTISGNLPLRLLVYAGRIYEKIVNPKKKFKKKLIKIPRPEFIVLYNGTEKCPDYSELKLSDAFMGVKGLKVKNLDKLPLELIVQAYNINQKHNTEILKKCETLDNYSIFVDKLQEFIKSGKNLEESVKLVIKYCIDNNILKKYLTEHGSEVYNMIFGEWNWDDALEVAREEGHEDGLEEGLEFTARNALSKGIPVQTVQEITGLSMEKIKEINQILY